MKSYIPNYVYINLERVSLKQGIHKVWEEVSDVWQCLV